MIDDIVFPSLCDRLHVMQLMIMARLCLDKAEELISETDSLRSPICIKMAIRDLETVNMNSKAIIYRLEEIQK